MTKKNKNLLSKKIVISEVVEVDEKVKEVNISENDDAKKVIEKSTLIGYDNDEDLLNEINSRISILNRHTFLLKKIPRNLTRRSLNQLIPEMVNCRFTLTKKGLNNGYAFIQMSSNEMVDKYIQVLNKSNIFNKKMIAARVKPMKSFKSLKSFDLKSLYFNGLKPNTKLTDITNVYGNAKVKFLTNEDKSAQGMFTLYFSNEEDAKIAFAENKLKVNGVKVQLNYVIKNSDKDVKEILEEKFNFEKPEELISEIRSRFEALQGRTIVIKNLDPLSVTYLKELIPSMRNCKINKVKHLGFVEFDTCEEAMTVMKDINGKIFGKKTVRAIIAKKQIDIINLSQFDLTSIHLSNLPINTTESDIENIFPKCEIDLPLNDDKTCMGNATLKFDTKENALKAFNKSDVLIHNVKFDVNFHIIVINRESNTSKNNKRKHENEADMDENNMNKKIKVSDSEIIKSKKRSRQEDSEDKMIVNKKNVKKSKIQNIIPLKKTKVEEKNNQLKKSQKENVHQVKKENLEDMKMQVKQNSKKDKKRNSKKQCIMK